MAQDVVHYRFILLNFRFALKPIALLCLCSCSLKTTIKQINSERFEHVSCGTATIKYYIEIYIGWNQEKYTSRIK